MFGYVSRPAPSLPGPVPAANDWLTEIAVGSRG
jgi:hypothetical protein